MAERVSLSSREWPGSSMCRYTAEVGPKDNSSEDTVWMGSQTVSSSVKTKMPLSRRNYLKSLLLQIGQSLVEQEAQRLEWEKQSYVDENCPSLSVPHSVQKLQELCRKLHKEIDLVDEERYDLEIKVTKSDKEIDGLKIKLQDLNGRFQKPVLRKVRMSADAMLAALLGSKHKVSMDLRGNLRQVKKATKEEEKQATDWRKNIEDKAGMDGRKRMFETEA